MFDAPVRATPVALFGPWADTTTTGAVLLGVVAVFGHVFSVFVDFNGGKGVATSAGIVLGLAPGALGVTLAVWGIHSIFRLRLAGEHHRALLALPAAVWLIQPSRRNTVWCFAALAVVVIWFHRSNIRRLLNGTEHRFRSGTPVSPSGRA